MVRTLLYIYCNLEQFLVTPARHLPPREEPYAQPLPVILDPRLRILDFKDKCKLFANARAGTGRRPLILCARASEEAERPLRSVADIHHVELGDDGTSLRAALFSFDSRQSRMEDGFRCSLSYRRSKYTRYGLSWSKGVRESSRRSLLMSHLSYTL